MIALKNLIKRYWDILGGVFSGVGLSVLVEFKLESIQLAYSIIILVLVSIGILRIFKESLEKRKNKREHNIIDDIVDAQKPMKAIDFANNPTKQGEEIGKTFILTYKEVHSGMEKVKTLWSKYKGLIVSGLTFVLAFIEGHYGIINELCGEYLVFHGIEILPIAFIIISLVVAFLSNTFDKEEWELVLTTIKTFRDKKNDNKALNDELKKIIKENEGVLKGAYKELTTAEHKLATDEATLKNAQNSLDVKTQLYVSKIIPVSEYNTARESLDKANQEVHKDLQEVERLNKQVGELETKLEELKSKKV